MKNAAIEIVRVLQEAGHTAYWAGGCVRDLLRGVHPKDYDIATSATPDQVEALFEKTIPIGKSFGVITTEWEGHRFEIASFRSDAPDGDGRRPSSVRYTHPAEDALRRDFTINGLFFDPIYEEIHDFVGGQDDLKNKLIRFIGDPAQRIQEDHLRIMRALRFKNTLEFSYHPDTYRAIQRHAALASKVSAERLRDEFNKILFSPSVSRALEDLQDTGVLTHVFPELERCKGVAQPPEFHQEGDVWTHLMLALDALDPETPLLARWAVLFHDIGKPETFKIAERIRFDRHSEVSAEIAERVMRRLKFSRQDIEHVTWVVRHHFMMVDLLKMPLGRKRRWFLDPRFPTLLTLFYADAAGTRPVDLGLFEAVTAEYEEVKAYFGSLPQPLISGQDVMDNYGLKPGPQVGEILKDAMEAQLAHEFENRTQALNWLQQRG